jgi:hypothetical protein
MTEVKKRGEDEGRSRAWYDRPIPVSIVIAILSAMIFYALPSEQQLSVRSFLPPFVPSFVPLLYDFFMHSFLGTLLP